MNLLKELLIDTYSGDYYVIVNTISSFLKEKTQAEVIIQEHGANKMNVIAKFGDPKLLINCHMDTVPPAGEWSYPPLQYTETSSRIYGLGSADTKGNIYCLLKAVEKECPKDLCLLFSTDEEKESSGSGVIFFLQSAFAKGMKYALVCEPTSLAFVDRHKGYYSFKVKVSSTPKHSSLTGSGPSENAIAKAARIISKLDEAGYNIGSIKGDGMGNVISSQCEFKISIRTYDGPEKVKKMLESHIKDVSSVEVEPCFYGLPLIGNNGSFPFSITKTTEVNFWTEATLFSQAGINSLVFGAGNIKQAHAPNEYVEKEQLEIAQLMFQKIIGEML